MGSVSVVPLGLILGIALALQRLVTELVHSELTVSRIEPRSLRLSIIVLSLGIPSRWSSSVVAWWRTSHVARWWASEMLERRAASGVVASTTSTSCSRNSSHWGRTITSAVVVVVRIEGFS